MLTHLQLQNFQSWASLDLPLSPVVVIVGETNQGKSAILRALSAVLYNSLDGTSFVRQGAKLATVGLTTAAGTVVQLEKGAGVNRYTVTPAVGSPIVYDKVARQVPEGVQTALGVSEVKFEDDGTALTLQFQPQMDAPFLLADQGVRATRLLGSVSQVATLYQAARVAGTRRREAATTVAALQTVAADAAQQATRYQYLDGVVPLIARVETLDARQQALRQDAARLAAVAQALADGRAQHARACQEERAWGGIVQARGRQVRALDTWVRLQQAAISVQVAQAAQDVASARVATLSRLVQTGLRIAGLRELQVALLAYRATMTQWFAAREAEVAQQNRVVELSQRVRDLESQLACVTCGRMPDVV